jgi:hypothetical protein
MVRIHKATALFAVFLLLCVLVEELWHFHQYGHFAPFGLHADVVVAARKNISVLTAPRRYTGRS